MTFQGDGGFEGGRVKTRSAGRTAAVGGGAGALLVAIVAIVLQMSGNQGAADLVNGLVREGPAAEQTQGTIGDCSVEQANSQRDCRLSATVYSLDAYWEPVVGSSFVLPDVVSFDQQTSTGCGDASAATGPFYCPPDQTIYLDLGFFDQLQSQFGATDGPLAEEYVVAHEYGHHIQQITGVMDKANRGGTGADSDSVKIELQADCYAGLWAGHAATTKRPGTDETFLQPITKAELQQALDAAAAVGDDHIQEQATGRVDQDSWTHGSSAERQRWFSTGYEKGTLEACDTFSASSL
ncbi:neutral zinc metallopeptidase [Cellulomonas sp. HZM]|uniref:KPN_02809 family neutral zinc metallopeptidase n=1 Tax=Cellulomonas sp. HZM TaxID=1454010 RepID=UPI000493A9DD|nr:neutral zinc metallopeptidase [Cellulomonas sp. HZM]